MVENIFKRQPALNGPEEEDLKQKPISGARPPDLRRRYSRFVEVKLKIEYVDACYRVN